jgi:hypothetical protein
MISQPRIGIFVLLASGLALTCALALRLPSGLYWRVAPERYLMSARAFYGQRLVSDEGVSDSYAPTPLLAWRRLAEAKDTAAFGRLLASGTPAAKVYGLAGLQALSPLDSTRDIISAARSADSLYMNAECTAGVVPLREAFVVVGTPERARRLLRALTICP